MQDLIPVSLPIQFGLHNLFTLIKPTQLTPLSDWFASLETTSRQCDAICYKNNNKNKNTNQVAATKIFREFCAF